MLTEIRNWDYSEEYLARRVNDNLGDYLELGKLVAALQNNMNFSGDSVSSEHNSIVFPDGRYWAEYSAITQKRGDLVEHVSFDLQGWVGRHEEMVKIITLLRVHPTRVVFVLSKKIDPATLVSGLQQQGWRLENVLPRQITARMNEYTVVIEDFLITFDGLSPRELLGSPIDATEVTLVARVLALLGRGGE